MSYDFDSLNFSNTPKFINGCDHKKEEYVGSFLIEKLTDKQIIKEWFDLYIFGECNNQNVCIRYGNIDREYISPGRLYFFLQNMGDIEVYQKAFELMKRKGIFTYYRKDKIS